MLKDIKCHKPKNRKSGLDDALLRLLHAVVSLGDMPDASGAFSAEAKPVNLGGCP